MNRERWVQLIAGLVTAAALAGSIALVPTIKQQRSDLSPNVDLAGLPADYALTTTALGPFRGLFVDWLWYRAEMMKREGKIYEVNTLANWITTLQPRFPMVWRFHAWNLAYNISVKTDTPQERWRWVQKGIRLLRSEGIPHNPKSLALYRELGLIFWHKVGKSSDDMHWYYKYQMARRWHKILGNMSAGVDQQTAAARMRPIAEMAERYFRSDEPPEPQRRTLTQLAEQFPDYAERLNRLKQMRLSEAIDTLVRYRRQWRSEAPELVGQLAPVLQALRAHPAMTGENRLALLQKAHPGTSAIISRLRAAGVSMDTAGLKQIGGLMMKMQFLSPRALDQNPGQLLTGAERKILPIVRRYRGQQAWGHLLTFLRAKALNEHYHMDPGFMLELMQRFGPLDWRHPASHAIYWSALGIQRARIDAGDTSTSALNTDRQVIHGLQMLFNNGRIEFSLGGMSLLPDLRFIAPYEKAKFGARRRAELRQAGDREVHAFDAGHRNFLEEAVEKSYLYGDTAKAQRYYKKVRRIYGRGGEAVGRGRGVFTGVNYQLPLPEFVARRMQRELGQDKETTSAFVTTMVRRGLRQGLAHGDAAAFQHFIEVAQAAYRRYHEEGPGRYKTPETGRGRLALRPFNQILIDTYAGLMRDNSVGLLERARIYHNTPPSLQRRAYDQFRGQLAGEVQQRGASMQRLFPPPSGRGSGAANQGTGSGNPGSGAANQ